MRRMTREELLAIRNSAVELYPVRLGDIVNHRGSNAPMHRLIAIELTMMEMVESMVRLKCRDEMSAVVHQHTTPPHVLQENSRCVSCGARVTWGDPTSENHLDSCSAMIEMRNKRPLKAGLIDLIAQANS